MRRDRQPQRVWSAAIAHTITKPVIAVVMGVSGSGKTTVSALLAAALGCQFQEGDDLHPAANVEKMHSGTPLTDADRLPWLRKIAEEIDGWRARRIRRAHLLGAEAFLPGHHHRRSPRRDAGLPQRIARPHPPAHGRAARALHAGGPARQPVCDTAGADARRASDHRRCRRPANRDRRRDRASARGAARQR